MDLNHYNQLPSYHPLQPVIDETFDTLNYAIRADNINHGIYHPTLTSKIHLKRRGKAQRNQYRLLWDGVHLSEPVLRDWAVNIHKFHVNIHRTSVAKATCPLSTPIDCTPVPDTTIVPYSNVCTAYVAKATCPPLNTVDLSPVSDPKYGNLTLCGPTVYE